CFVSQLLNVPATATVRACGKLRRNSTVFSLGFSPFGFSAIGFSAIGFSPTLGVVLRAFGVVTGRSTMLVSVCLGSICCSPICFVLTKIERRRFSSWQL